MTQDTSEERGKGIGGGGKVGRGVECGGPKNVFFLMALFLNDSLIPINSGKLVKLIRCRQKLKICSK